MTEIEELKATNLFLSNELRRANIDRLEVQEELESTNESMNKAIERQAKLVTKIKDRDKTIEILQEELNYHTNDNDVPIRREVSE